MNDTKESCERGAPIVETVDGGSSGPPQTQIAQAAPQERPVAGSGETPAPPGYGPPSDQRVAQNYYGPNYPAPSGYYAPQPNPYRQAPPPSTPRPPPGYYPNSR